MTLVHVDQPAERIPFYNRLKGLSKPLKIGVLAMVLTLLTLTAGVLYISQPSLKPLATGLSETQSSAIIHKLDELKINYKLTEGGTIMVDTKELSRIRMELAGSGLAEDGEVGFALFDRINLQMTEFSEQVTYLRALQGELAETIKSLPGVAKVRVHLNIPKDSLLTEDHNAPTASVMVTLKPGARLTRNQCRGILKLVASSVEGLKTEQVTLTDTTGNLLFTGEEELAGGGGVEAEEQVSRQLQRSAQQVLDNVVGPGRGVANVRVEFQKDLRKVEKTVVETNKEGKGYERTHKTTSEDYLGTSKTAGQPQEAAAANVTLPPTAANSTTTAGNATSIKEGENKPKYRQTSDQVEYEYGHRTETLQEDPQRIRRVTASVVVDGNVKLDKKGQDALQQAIALAVGIDTNRGDECTVQVLPFAREAEDKPEVPASAGVIDKKLAIGIGAGGLFGGLMLLGLVSRLRKPKVSQAHPEAGAAGTEGEGEGEGTVGSKVDISLPAEDELAVLPARSSLEEMMAQARLAAKENPDQVARLLVGWMNHDKAKR
ncbi:flagellar M-ring protein FliF [bacterium]|nr:flagellar M-ring protein FliF [bacterium]